MKEKYKILMLEDRYEVHDHEGLIRVFNIRASDGKYAKCIAHDRALCFVEVLYSKAIDW